MVYVFNAKGVVISYEDKTFWTHAEATYEWMQHENSATTQVEGMEKPALRRSRKW